jgi:hypothetical protein
MRYIIMYSGLVDRRDLEHLKDRPAVEVYRLHPGLDQEDQVEMALLNDLVTPLKLAFVGGDDAKQLDGQYGGVWIADSPTVEQDLEGLWGLPCG